jgi:hypothetical protein
MLWNVGDVIRRTQALLDDPAGSEFDKDYLMPFLNQKWDDLSTELSMLGLDYQEVRLVLANVAAGTTSLDDYMRDGQPLQSLMMPRRIEWKTFGASDTEYKDAILVEDLDDYPAGVIGIPEWAWTGGSIQLAPSAVAVDLRVTFNAMSTTLVDPADKTIRGVTNILAYNLSSLVYDLRGNQELAQTRKQDGDDALDTFERAAVMRDQAKLNRVPPMHPRFVAAGMIIAPTNNP